MKACGIFCWLLPFVLVGCGAVESNWYPVQGGYINLRQVAHIDTKFSMTLKVVEKEGDEDERLVRSEVIADDELITAEKIDAAKRKIRELSSKGDAFNRISYNAAIIFAYSGGGTHTVKLQELADWSSNDDLFDLLDAWLSAIKDLKLNLGRVIDLAE